MNFRTCVGGIWKAVANTAVFKVRVAGAWKDVAVVNVYDTVVNSFDPNGVAGWRPAWVRAAVVPTPPPVPVPVPIPPPPVVLTVNVVPTEVSGTLVNPGVVTTNPAVAQASGGTAPYTYQWVFNSWTNALHSPIFQTPTAPQTTISNQLDYNDDYQNALIKCIVTDSLGNSGSGTGTASFYTTHQEHTGGGGSGGGGPGGPPWGGGGWTPEP